RVRCRRSSPTTASPRSGATTSRRTRSSSSRSELGGRPRPRRRPMTVEALPTREQALALLHEWVENVNLRKHCYAVEACMRAYARKQSADEERWGLTGLIHDFDWERHPDLERHPMNGVEVLRAAGWPEDVCRAVLGHAVHSGVPRDTEMAKA